MVGKNMTDSDHSIAHCEKRELGIINRKGLHARAAAKFVRITNGSASDVWVRRDGNRVDGTAIMDLLMLAAVQGTTITVEAEGPDAVDVVDALESLVENRFDEHD